MQTGHADDPLGDGLGDEAGDDIGLVAASSGHDHVGGPYAGLEQVRGRAALAGHGAHIDSVLRPAQCLLVVAHHDDVVTLLGDLLGDVEAEGPGPDDDDLHSRPPPWLCTVPVTR